MLFRPSTFDFRLPALLALAALAGCPGADPDPVAQGPSAPADGSAAADAERVSAPAVGSSNAAPSSAEVPAGAAAEAETADLVAQLVPTRNAPCIFCADPRVEPVAIFFSPARPVAGRPLRAVVVSEHNASQPRLVLQERREARPVPLEEWGGPPWAWTGTLANAPAGRLRFCFSGDAAEEPPACASVVVAAEAAEPSPPSSSGIWAIERPWDRSLESFYSAWIARLFLVEPGMTAGWRPLHKALRDARRNLLYDHLGRGEDDPASPVNAVLAPDCGDAPYFLRAYFAWKLALPFAAHLCPRGEPGLGPQCDGWFFTNLSPAWDGIADPVERFNRFLAESVARFVHSGTARTLPEDEFGDFYPVALTREALRPGTIFVDPRGHILILTRWLPGTRERLGTLYAVDGHPDQSLTFKRFSPSTFFYSTRVRTGGFKAFRPLRYADGQFCFASNAELQSATSATRQSTEQYEFPDAAAFYWSIDRLLNPVPPDPLLAFRDRAALLVELLAQREEAVQVAVDAMEATTWERIPMPSGVAIFETSGPWEDYATPARDLRLLIAADELLAFPALVVESPGLFTLPPGKTPEEVRAELDAAWVQLQDELQLAYRRSDGTPWTITLGEFMRRLVPFQMAYNPNDCPEVRWGAPEGSDEISTCVHRAPTGQLHMMAGVRMWFSARRQPAGL
jgi:hypothetical protein